MKIINGQLLKQIIYYEQDIPNDEILLFENCDFVRPVHGVLSAKNPIFKDCKYLILNDTNAEFNFYWVNRIVFPNVEKIVLNGYFDDFHCYFRFPIESMTLVDRFGLNGLNGHKSISTQEFQELVEQLKKENGLISGFFNGIKRYIMSYDISGMFSSILDTIVNYST
jgi:hypothetical protein